MVHDLFKSFYNRRTAVVAVARPVCYGGGAVKGAAEVPLAGGAVRTQKGRLLPAQGSR
jgi:hypothetical protein